MKDYNDRLKYLAEGLLTGEEQELKRNVLKEHNSEIIENGRLNGRNPVTAEWDKDIDNNYNEYVNRVRLLKSVQGTDRHLVLWERLEVALGVILFALVVILNISQMIKTGGITWFMILIPVSALFLITLIKEKI